MYSHQQPIEMPDLDTHELQSPPDVNQKLLQTIDQNIKSQNWIQSHHCITMLRQIIKFYPIHTIDIIQKYSSVLAELFTNRRTQIDKNLLRLLKQIFDHGPSKDVSRAICVFVPILLKKAPTDLGHIKQMSQQVLKSFANNCGYDSSFIVTAQFCSDKNIQIVQISVQLIAVLVQNVGPSVLKLSPQTQQILMGNLIQLIDGKRQNLRNQALDICLSIYKNIGSENYLVLMNKYLNQNETQIMGNSMETHRVSKQKRVSLGQIIKQRKTMMNVNGGNSYGNGGFGGYGANFR